MCAVFAFCGAAEELNLGANGAVENTEFQEHFTVDYFTQNINKWADVFGKMSYNKHSALNFLEIGSLEGRSTTWLLKNILQHPDSRITCVDTWQGSIEHPAELKEGLYERFIHNIQPHISKVDVKRGFSNKMLRDPKIQSQIFDFIYIDGGHHSRNALEDAILAFPLLKKHGILIFDDYLIGTDAFAQSNDEPKAGIDAFLRFYAGSYNVFEHSYQLGLQKLKDPEDL